MSKRSKIESESSVDEEYVMRNGSDHSSGKKETAHDWEAEKNRTKMFFDDGTMSFFWRAHTITVLVVFSCLLFYVAVIEENTASSSEYNTKRGLLFTMLAFLLFGVIHTPDGPFRRPHPAFWRFILCLSILYALLLVFLLFQVRETRLCGPSRLNVANGLNGADWVCAGEFGLEVGWPKIRKSTSRQNVDDARQMLRHFDEDLGKELPDKDYGGNCFIYDPSNETNPFHNVWDKMDGFFVVHFFGWWLKAMILRDYWLCTVLSFMFEVLEYTLEHQLPNFSECWWDHWVMDFLLCNYLGIYCGMRTCNYLSMKPYRWSGMWKIPGYKGKLKRIALQFTPHRWTDFDWKATQSLKRWLAMLAIIAVFLLAELNTFYLKFILWVPPPHFLCLGRLTLFLFMGATAMREAFEYLDNPHCERFGRQSWIICCIIITEFLIVVKFDSDTVSKPLPRHVVLIWGIGISLLVLWTFWHFFIKSLLVHSARKERWERRVAENDVDSDGRQDSVSAKITEKAEPTDAANGGSSTRRRH